MDTPDRFGSCVLKIDSLGNPIWFKQFDLGNNYNGIDKVLTDENENVFVMGSYRNTATSRNEKFICKLLNSSIYVSKRVMVEKRLLIYPNPATERITINGDQHSGSGTLQIYNVSGKEIWKQDFEEASIVVDVSNFSKGIYLAKLTVSGSILTGKIVKE